MSKVVRVVYLSPSDRSFQPQYAQWLTNATRNLQAWFATQLDGQTFATRDGDFVEWYQLPRAASAYQTGTKRRTDASNHFWEAVLDDAFRLTSGGFNDPDQRFLYFVDAYPLCGQSIGGTSGVALMGANDLRVPCGEPEVLPCPEEVPADPPAPLGRWIGGMGHELGHAFGLDHPEDSPDGPDDGCLMFLGYATYPDTYLRPSDKVYLLQTGFFAPVDGTDSGETK